jgi:hypothetical protein
MCKANHDAILAHYRAAQSVQQHQDISHVGDISGERNTALKAHHSITVAFVVVEVCVRGRSAAHCSCEPEETTIAQF